MKFILSPIAIIGLLAGCADNGSLSLSSLNPFRAPPPAEETLITATRVPDGRELIGSITELKAEPTRNGLILRARGEAPVQGYFAVELTETNNGLPDQTGTLTFELRGRPPVDPLPAATRRSREIVAGVFVSGVTLRSVRALRVVAAQTQITIRK